MKRISSIDIAVRDAFQKGYRVNKNGISGQIKKSRTSTTGYLLIPYRCNGKAIPFPIHKLCAYQKYGEITFSADCVRHLDGNRTNNAPNNIEIGTYSENMMDIPKETRLRVAVNATRSKKTYTSVEVTKKIREYFKETKSEQKTMEKFDIKSKSSLRYILYKKKY